MASHPDSVSSATPTDDRPLRQRTVGDRVLGFLGAAMILAALLLLVFGGPRDEGAALAGPAPTLVLQQPSDGARVTAPLELHFTSQTSLGRVPGGWGADGLHIHAEVNGREVMPGPTDIQRLTDGSYRWTLRGIAPGEHTVRLFWSDAAHRPLEGGASSRVGITVN